MNENRFTYKEVLGLRFPTSLMGQSRAYSHIYYVDGLLIDTGHPRKRKDVLKAVDGLPVKQIFITHHHEDHSGNIPELQRKFNCKVYSSTLCAQYMKDPPPLTFAQKLYWGIRGPYHDLIPLEGTFKTENYEFQLIPIPGHAADMLALYEPNKRWLFSADLYINSRIGYYITTESIKEQIESINRILELDFDVMFCSHNPQLTNGKVKLKEKLDFLEDFVKDVMKLSDKGHQPKEIFKLLKLKELKTIKFLSSGELSKMNMVKSVLRDY
ncbi:MAG: MBL fold metallo-hydrolase [Crocinitomicaceae bacterium]|nr:MBL fold metallo-hydrolase [Crocinitomicaceae bacterium]